MNHHILFQVTFLKNNNNNSPQSEIKTTSKCPVPHAAQAAPITQPTFLLSFSVLVPLSIW